MIVSMGGKIKTGRIKLRNRLYIAERNYLKSNPIFILAGQTY